MVRSSTLFLRLGTFDVEICTLVKQNCLTKVTFLTHPNLKDSVYFQLRSFEIELYSIAKNRKIIPLLNVSFCI